MVQSFDYYTKSVYDRWSRSGLSSLRSAVFPKCKHWKAHSPLARRVFDVNGIVQALSCILCLIYLQTHVHTFSKKNGTHLVHYIQMCENCGIAEHVLHNRRSPTLPGICNSCESPHLNQQNTMLLHVARTSGAEVSHVLGGFSSTHLPA